MRERLVVIDETGGSSRPLETDGEGFGVGAIVFPAKLEKDLVDSSQEIAKLVGNLDFKYKHVQKNTAARKLFIKTMNSRTDLVNAYASYSCGSGVAREVDRTEAAALVYGSPVSGRFSGSTDTLLDQFLGYMTTSIARHAHVNNYIARIYWDDRTDLSFVKERVDSYIAMCINYPAFRGAEKHIKFEGVAKKDLAHISRLAGVLAGDIRQFFNIHGPRIWKHLDPAGLIQMSDPHLTTGLHTAPSVIVKTMTETLADRDPITASKETVMLQGYHKCFLQHDITHRRLISFGSPNGQVGVLEIENGRLWHINQHAD